MVVEPDGRRSERVYWNPPHERDEDRSPEEWRDALLDALRVAVRRRMVSDVPVGVLLSGGLDSSLIVALLAEQGQRGLATFSIGFPDAGGREGNEFAFSDLVAARVRDRPPPDPGRDGELVEALPQAIAAMSEPMVSHDCVAFWLLAQAVSRERKVVQSGQGADEVLGGYSWYPPLLDAPGSGLDAYAAEFFDRDHDGVARAHRGRGGRGRLARVRRRVVRAPGRRVAGRPRAAPGLPRSCSSTTRSSAWTT